MACRSNHPHQACSSATASGGHLRATLLGTTGAPSCVARVRSGAFEAAPVLGHPSSLTLRRGSRGRTARPSYAATNALRDGHRPFTCRRDLSRRIAPSMNGCLCEPMLPTNGTEDGSERPPRDPFDGTAYRLIRKVGEGGMGEVFEVQHRELGYVRVAKMLRLELSVRARIVDRMRLEAQSLERLNHPNIVAPVYFGRNWQGRPFIILERLAGHTLAHELRGGRSLPLVEALHFAMCALAGLDAAHRLGLVHRDIKPQNLFVATQPNGERIVKVLDFGLVRVLPDAPEDAPDPLESSTSSNEIVGTPKYMSPEGASRVKVDGRADVYGVALVLFRMITGQGPFDHVRPSYVLDAHRYEQPRAMSAYTSLPVPPELDRCVLKALRKEPAERYQTATEFRTALEQILGNLRQPLGYAETSVLESKAARGLVAEEEQASRVESFGLHDETEKIEPVLAAVPKLVRTEPTEPLSEPPSEHEPSAIWDKTLQSAAPAAPVFSSQRAHGARHLAAGSALALVFAVIVMSAALVAALGWFVGK